jgi:hypothetical protein
MERVTCSHCSDVIGAYEPMILVTDGHARSTSRALEPVAAKLGDCYHGSCYERAHGDGPEAVP